MNLGYSAETSEGLRLRGILISVAGGEKGELTELPSGYADSTLLDGIETDIAAGSRPPSNDG